MRKSEPERIQHTASPSASGIASGHMSKTEAGSCDFRWRKWELGEASWRLRSLLSFFVYVFIRVFNWVTDRWEQSFLSQWPNRDVLFHLQNCDAFARPVTTVGLYLLSLMFVAPCPSRCRVIPGMSAVRRDSSARLGGKSFLLLDRWSDRGTLLCEKWQRERPWTRHRRVRVAFPESQKYQV